MTVQASNPGPQAAPRSASSAGAPSGAASSGASPGPAAASTALSYDICTVGTGPAGLAGALALAQTGLRIAVIGPAPNGQDTRTAALFAGSVTLLENLGLGEACRADGEPIFAIRVIDDMGGLLRAPEVTFTAQEVERELFGLNISNVGLVRALRERMLQSPNITLIEDNVTAVTVADDHAAITLAAGPVVTARLVVGADGRNSLCRQAAGIDVKTWGYDQSAIACTFTHSGKHRGISTEFHRPAGPMTFVPATPNSSGLVWVEHPTVAAEMAALDTEAFRAVLAERLQGLLGDIGEIGPRAVFPLSGLIAKDAGRSRVALVGEAAHVIPPIGAQGLNLGLRDAASIADCVTDALATGADIGGDSVLAAYGRMRHTDISARIWSIDLLNRSLLVQSPPVQALRGLGLHILKSVGPLRRFAIREGLHPSFVMPRLMQPHTASAGSPHP
ncbi:FAD-dependent monooxygenase [Hyphomicrobium sulfonivorans]|uniref:FAD-dependent monooxygenase n=1 Tax=Hyphomicrobium sulfonivorans TaxID=121290 RepID=UPI0018E15036|nr:FAD-dependent monooxygenase [Hyphomicrobium sulfonivorans]MBI1650572.1 FAD-dependent monooxygenase [Hyphomicrobium sulfonivorans]